jgi:uncharacterized protein
MADSVVYVVAKAPRPGAVKTRLSPILDPEQSAALARGFLLDTLATVRAATGVATRVVCRDPADASAIREMVGEVDLLCQRGDGLGAALEECFQAGLAAGFARVAVLGSDSPTLPGWIIGRAFASLDACDIAIGPTEDGGYYLLAARVLHPTLFRGMVWSTDSVFRETLARCEAAGLLTTILPTWYDVDAPDDLERLRSDLAAGPPDVAPHTRRALDRSAVDGPGLPAPAAAPLVGIGSLAHRGRAPDARTGA